MPRMTRGHTCTIAFSLFFHGAWSVEFQHLLFLKLHNFFTKFILFSESNFQSWNLYIAWLSSLPDLEGAFKQLCSISLPFLSVDNQRPINLICYQKHRTFSVHVSSLHHPNYPSNTIYACLTFLLHQYMISLLPYLTRS